jgi:methylase of polypeptide subunit release factors
LLDVGVGGAGICITMCQRHRELRAVGLDVSPSAIAVARDEVAAAGLAERIEIREQSVVDIDDLAAFDLIWLPQPFLPWPVLAQAMPSLYRAARPNGALVMLLATNQYDGPLGASVDVRNHVVGGGSIAPETAESLLAGAGFDAVQALQLSGGIVMLARMAG